MQEQEFRALAGLLETYRKNRQQVPEEQLRTKYRAAWEGLKEKICAESKRVCVQLLMEATGGEIFRDDWMDPGGFRDRIEEAWAVGGYPLKTGRALFKSTDLDEYRLILQDFQKEIETIHADYLRKRSEK